MNITHQISLRVAVGLADRVGAGSACLADRVNFTLAIRIVLCYNYSIEQFYIWQ